jgi:hypothetical protein
LAGDPGQSSPSSSIDLQLEVSVQIATIEQTVGKPDRIVLPLKMRGLRPRDLENFMGRVKAFKIIDYLVTGAGPNVVGFPLHLAREPELARDPVTLDWIRVFPKKQKRADVVRPFPSRGGQAA